MDLYGVQGLMGAALHASTPHMAGALRRVLGGLHGAKSAPGVDALLLRLYRPILFRALGAANPAVRRNALCCWSMHSPFRWASTWPFLSSSLEAVLYASLSVRLQAEQQSYLIKAICGTLWMLKSLLGPFLFDVWELNTIWAAADQQSAAKMMSAQDPDASNEDTDEVLTRQFTAFGDALGDECPAVRAEAVTGLAGLLDTFWELVPAAATAGFLQRIAGGWSFNLTIDNAWIKTSTQ